MSLYAISDLHLDSSFEKPMDIFGENWIGHRGKIESSWVANVNPWDTVIIPGDICWGKRLEDARDDLSFISRLPGTKILVRGNHDYWWASLKKSRETFPDIRFIQNDYCVYNDYAICGSRGWLCPNDTAFTEKDEKIYRREINRLEASFSAARRAGFKKYISATHFPPVNNKKERCGFIDIIESYGAEYAIFGHLHGEDAARFGKLKLGSCEYILTSCDFLDFEVKLIME